MKIYNKVRFNIDTWEVLEEDSYEHHGSISECRGGGGGGASGTIEYPAYIEAIHSNWLAMTNEAGSNHVDILVDITTLLNTALAADTPYTGETAYPPDTYLTAVQTQYDSFETAAEAISEESDWESFVDTIVAKLDDGTTFPVVSILGALSTAVSTAITAANTAIASAPITAMVDRFESNKLPRLRRDLSRMAASLAEVNAVQTTTFGMGFAVLQSEFSKDVDAFEAGLHFDIYKNILVESIRAHVEAELRRANIRDAFVTTATRDLISLLGVKLNSLRDASSLLATINSQAIVAKKEENDFNLELDVREAIWDLELFQHGANVMAAAPGGVGSSMKQSLSPLSSALSGGLAGASVMSATGNPYAIAAGAGIGAVLGAFA